MGSRKRERALEHRQSGGGSSGNEHGFLTMSIESCYSVSEGSGRSRGSGGELWETTEGKMDGYLVLLDDSGGG